MPRWFLAAFLVLARSGVENFGVHGTSLDREVLGELGSGLVRREVQKATLDHRGSVSTRRGTHGSFDDMLICNEDFVVGKPAQANNTGPDGTETSAGHCLSDHEHILEESLCKRAADAVGAGAPITVDRALDPTTGNENTHPEGCFMKRGEDGKATYYFNEVFDEPIPTPYIEEGEAAVCRRDKYKRGKKFDSNDCPSSEYKKLYNRDICKIAAECLRYTDGKTEDSDFVVTDKDMTNHDFFPAGCSLTEPRTVKYNPPNWGKITFDEPHKPKGLIICVANSVDIESTRAKKSKTDKKEFTGGNSTGISTGNSTEKKNKDTDSKNKSKTEES